METFWYWLYQVQLEKWPLNWRDRERVELRWQWWPMLQSNHHCQHNRTRFLLQARFTYCYPPTWGMFVTAVWISYAFCPMRTLGSGPRACSGVERIDLLWNDRPAPFPGHMSQALSVLSLLPQVSLELRTVVSCSAAAVSVHQCHLTVTWLHCVLSLAAQCIVIIPVCGGRAACVCGSVTTINRNCVHWSSPNWVCMWRQWPCPAD